MAHDRDRPVFEPVQQELDACRRWPGQCIWRM
jgi:hypothetical protein